MLLRKSATVDRLGPKALKLYHPKVATFIHDEYPAFDL